MVREFSFSFGFRRIDNNKSLDPDRKPRPVARAIAVMFAITGLMALPALRLAQLQLVEGEQNSERADKNRIRLVPIPSNRGAIFDRNNKYLAGTRLIRSVYLWPGEQSREQWEITAAKLSPILDIPTANIIRKLEVATAHEERNVAISQQVTPDVFISLKERGGEFPGVEVRAESTRYYPQRELASHLIGHIGEVTPEEIETNSKYRLKMKIGKEGVEAAANDILSGTWGDRLIEVNALGQKIGELGEISPIGGDTVQLTLDLNLQKTAERALGPRKGAVVVLDANTGEILTMASYPRFDPNIFTKPVSEGGWKDIQGRDNPFVNRALQGYPPGSTFKIVTSAAAIGSGHYSPYSMLNTYPYIWVGGIRFNEHRGASYGYIGFREALAYSSNSFFYQLGLGVGADEIYKWARRLGLGGVDLDVLGISTSYNGMIPNPDLKQELYGDYWYAGDTVNMSIGQGMVLCTPLELAKMAAAIGNGGYRVKPHLFRSDTNTPLTAPEPVGLSPEAVARIGQGMTDVVRYGTASFLADGSIPLSAGKTGTSEAGYGQKSHSVYVGFAPANKPEIAIAVVVENGGYGSVSAAPIAQKVYQTYFNK
ncbi:MAG: penicillin-binding protein 2 [Cyanobacteriota bacterium]|nr:penicillin-binding protein 2 [Cyanobacteriota bacterium]